MLSVTRRSVSRHLSHKVGLQHVGAPSRGNSPLLQVSEATRTTATTQRHRTEVVCGGIRHSSHGPPVPMHDGTTKPVKFLGHLHRVPAVTMKGKDTQRADALQRKRLKRLAGKTTVSKKHAKIMRYAKGFRGRAKSNYKIAIQRVTRSWQHAYRARKLRPRQYKTLWIQRIGAASRQHGVLYSTFIYRLKKMRVELNRKMLADMAVTEPYSFKAVLDCLKDPGCPMPAWDRRISPKAPIPD